MSFWNTSDGQTIDNNGKYEEESGGDLPPIPDDTQVLFAADQVKWDERNNDGNRFISIRWTVMKPAEFANRKVFQKLWVLGNNPKAKDPSAQADKHKRMLAAIDKNAGGKLFASGEMPTDETLSLNLANKPMVGKLGEWEFTTEDGKQMSGNWIKGVSPRQKTNAKPPQQQAPVQQQAAPEAQQQVPAQQQQAPVQQQTAPAAPAGSDFDDEIPF